MGPGSGLRLQLTTSQKTVSAGSIGNEQLISAWMISGTERPPRIESSSMRSKRSGSIYSSSRWGKRRGSNIPDSPQRGGDENEANVGELILFAEGHLEKLPFLSIRAQVGPDVAMSLNCIVRLESEFFEMPRIYLNKVRF